MSARWGRNAWDTMTALRNRRADAALARLHEAEVARREAQRREADAAAAFDRAERERCAQRACLYGSIAGRVLEAREILNLMDAVESLAHAAHVERAYLQGLGQVRADAADLVRKASETHGERRRAAEKAGELARRLGSEQSRRTDLLAEIEMEDIAAMVRAFSTRNGGHAG